MYKTEENETIIINEICGDIEHTKSHKKNLIPPEVTDVLYDIYENDEMGKSGIYSKIAVKLLYKAVNYLLLFTSLPVFIVGLAFCDKFTLFHSIINWNLSKTFYFILGCAMSYGVFTISNLAAVNLYLPDKDWDEEIDFFYDFRNERDVFNYLSIGTKSNLFMTGLFLILSRYGQIFAIMALGCAVSLISDILITPESDSMNLLDFYILKNHSIFAFSEWINYNFQDVFDVMGSDAIILRITYYIFLLIKFLIYTGFTFCIWNTFIFMITGGKHI